MNERIGRIVEKKWRGLGEFIQWSSRSIDMAVRIKLKSRTTKRAKRAQTKCTGKLRI